MNDFKKRNKFGGGEKGDRRGGNFGKKDFNRSHFGGDRPQRTDLFQAVCAACGKSCEVPFRPNGKKPVYCKECFDKNNGGNDSYNSPRPSAPSYGRERSEYRPARTEYRTERPQAPQSDSGMGEVKRQLETLNSKLDRLVTLMSEKAAPAPAVAEKASAPAKVVKEKKTAAKKKK
jgi:CxxC-x17-CxxC domain-containing protein